MHDMLGTSILGTAIVVRISGPDLDFDQWSACYLAICMWERLRLLYVLSI